MTDNNDWGTPDPQFQQPQQQQQYQPPSQPPQGQMQKPAKIKHQLETNDIIALVASFFLPGLGHLMAGQTVKGIAIFAVMVLSCGTGYMASLLVVADCFFVLNCKKDRPVGDWEFFPDYNRYI